jgi:hypothetical protein
MREFWRRHPRADLTFEFVMAAVVLLAGLGGYASDHDLSTRGVRGTAEVVQVLNGRDPQYRVRLTLPDGRTLTERTSYANTGAHVGDVIQVEYDPEDPTTVAQVGSRDDAWVLYGAWSLVGLGLLCHASWRLFKRGRSRPDGG